MVELDAVRKGPCCTKYIDFHFPHIIATCFPPRKNVINVCMVWQLIEILVNLIWRLIGPAGVERENRRNFVDSVDAEIDGRELTKLLGAPF